MMWTRLLLCTVCFLNPFRPAVNCTASFQLSTYTHCPLDQIHLFVSGVSIREHRVLRQKPELSVVYKNVWTRLHHGWVSPVPLLCQHQAAGRLKPYRADASFPPGCVEVGVSLLGFIDSYCWKNINKE